MRYYYEKPEEWTMVEGRVISFLHPLYNKATVYIDRNTHGVAVVQQRFNPKKKVMWWGPIDPWLVDDIASQSEFKDWLQKHSASKDENGLYPTFTVRELMYAMKMKPLKREIFEDIHWR